jgi:hypothetical protein
VLQKAIKVKSEKKWSNPRPRQYHRQRIHLAVFIKSVPHQRQSFISTKSNKLFNKVVEILRSVELDSVTGSEKEKMQIDRFETYCPQGYIAPSKFEVPRNFQQNCRKPSHGGITNMPGSTLVMKAD